MDHIYIDPINGDDANPRPVKTWRRVIELTDGTRSTTVHPISSCRHPGDGQRACR